MATMPLPAWACSVCFGAGDPDAAGFAWGVLILLVPVAIVQFFLVRFVVRAVRRERAGGISERVDSRIPPAEGGAAQGSGVS